MKFPWFGLTDEEIEVVVRDLLGRYGAGAPDEALRLCGVCRALGASKNERLYRIAARRSTLSLASAREAANWRFPDQVVRESS